MIIYMSKDEKERTDAAYLPYTALSANLCNWPNMSMLLHWHTRPIAKIGQERSLIEEAVAELSAAASSPTVVLLANLCNWPSMSVQKHWHTWPIAKIGRENNSGLRGHGREFCRGLTYFIKCARPIFAIGQVCQCRSTDILGQSQRLAEVQVIRTKRLRQKELPQPLWCL